jgi:hypothetical protein
MQILCLGSLIPGLDLKMPVLIGRDNFVVVANKKKPLTKTIFSKEDENKANMSDETDYFLHFSWNA